MKKLFGKYGYWVYGCMVLLAGIAVGLVLDSFILRISDNQSGCSIQQIREKGSYQFIDPLLAANPNDEYVPFENILKQDIFDYLNNTNVYTVSVYYQDLNSGEWAGINEDDSYNPASLLKVPIMMAYLKQAEANPALLAEKFVYQKEPADGTSTEFMTLVPGQEYTVDDLIQAMIVNSDNGAKYTLLQHIDSSAVLDVFSSLGVSEPDVPNYVISDKSYARFFKVLYNATYLDADMSERAMELLSQSTFKNGIAATIPTNIPIAHKFGQYTNSGLENSTKAWELSDCGIVYYPNDPYLLCVMTKGVDLNSLSATIQAVSKTVYSEIANKKL